MGKKLKTRTYIFRIATVAALAVCCPLIAHGQNGPIPEDPAVLEREARADKLVDTARKMLDEGKLDTAVATFQEALALDAQSTQGWHGLARAHTKQGKPDEAVADYRHFVSRDPKSGLHWVNGSSYQEAGLELAILLSKLGQKAEALELYHQALGLLNYTDNTSREPVPMTIVFDHGLDSMPYSLATFEAAARVAMGIEAGWTNSPAQFRIAAKLQPRLAIAQFYLGLALEPRGSKLPPPEVGAEKGDALRKASLYGDAEIKRAVRELLETGKVNPPKMSPRIRRVQLGLKTDPPVMTGNTIR